MKEVFWIDVSEEQPENGQWVFYIDTKSAGWYEKNLNSSVSAGDIDKGEYMKDNLVEWHYDHPCEEFKYWFPIPSKRK